MPTKDVGLSLVLLAEWNVSEMPAASIKLAGSRALLLCLFGGLSVFDNQP